MNGLRAALELLESDDQNSRRLVLAREEPDEEDEGRRLVFGRVALETSLADGIEGVLQGELSSIVSGLQAGTREVREYQASNLNLDRALVQTIDPEDVDAAPGIRDEVLDPDLEETTYGTGRRPSFQAIVVTARDGRQVIGFQKFTSRQILGRRGRLNMLLDSDGGEYKPFDGELLEIPTKIDAVLYEGMFYVLRQKRFEDIFDFFTQIEENTGEVLETLDQGPLAFADFELFEEAIRANRRIQRKLYEVTELGLYQHITTDDAEEIVDAYGLEISIGEDDDGTKRLEIPNKNKVWEVLHLLNDDYLESPLSENRYRAAGKEPQG